MANIEIKNPHALYYDGNLVGIVLDSDAYPGGVPDLCHRMSPDEGIADAVPIPQTMGAISEWQNFVAAVTALGVEETIETMGDDE